MTHKLKIASTSLKSNLKNKSQNFVDPIFSKTLALVKSKIKIQTYLNIIEHNLFKPQV